MTGTEAMWVISRRWRVVLVTTLVGATLAFLFGWGTRPEPSLYQATHALRLQPSAAVGSPVDDAVTAETLDSVTDVALSPEVLARVAADIGPQGDLSDLEVDPHPSRQTVDVSSVADDTERAVATANAVARALVAELDARQKALHRQQVDVTEGRLEALSAALRASDPRSATAEDVRRAQRDALLDTYAETYARAEELKSQPAPTSGLASLQEASGVIRIAGGGALGGRLPFVIVIGAFGFLGALVAFALESQGARVRAARGARRAFRQPVLAEIPTVTSEREGAIAERNSDAADAYRELRAALGVFLPATVSGNGNGLGPKPLILVTSAAGGEGTSSTVANLAASMAEAGQAVVVLDCDFERPRLHEYLDAGDGPGLSDALAGVKKAQNLEHLAVPTSVPGVRLVRAGTRLEHPAAAAARGRTLIDDARRLGAVVLVDAPPMLSSSDAFELAARADAVLVVCRDGETEVPAAERVADKLERLSPLVSGVVMMSIDGLPYGGAGGNRSWWNDRSGGPLHRLRARRGADEAARARVAEAAGTQRAAPTDGRATATAVAPTRPRAFSVVVRAWAPTIAVTLLLWLAVKTFAVESYAIPSSSMVPTLEPGDRVVVNKLSYRVGSVNRGDVVVFDKPKNLAANDRVHDLIKRVIAVGGDTVDATTDGRVLVNGEPVAEPYLSSGVTTTGLTRVTVPKGRIWVMGDNRGDSSDSRVFGPIAESTVAGRAFARIWPPQAVRGL